VSALTLTALQEIPIILHGDDLADIVVAALSSNGITLEQGDILVFAQKVVSKAEGRLINLVTIQPAQQAIDLAAQTEKDPRLVELILRESRNVLRTRPGTIVVEHKLGFICANAGIDHSNVEGAGNAAEEWVLMLPENPDQSAQMLRYAIQARTGKQIGILIIDSHGRAWRNGTVGMAIGISGLPGLQDLRGKPDLFGFTLRITQVGVADELAAAASLVMGQASEGTPVVHVRGFPYPLRESSLQELIRPRDQDLFR
jgi:coenzyme F420-0:L-glutamate ligase / coenzyme F420-1:gamma-L-glutamate ligase